MQVSYKPPLDHHGLLSKKRMHLGPMFPVPVNYATATIPTYAPFGTEYTPAHSLQIVGGRPIAYPTANVPSRKLFDPDLSPTKTIQNVHTMDNARWPQQPQGRFDTTYRTEYVNRLQHPDHYNTNNRHVPMSFNQYSVLPPIASKNTVNLNNYRNQSAAPLPITRTELEPLAPVPRIPDPPALNSFVHEIPTRSIQQNEDSYLPIEPVLLTDYEEQRLADQIRSQLASPNIVDRLKIFFQELISYDHQRSFFVHYSTIQMMAEQLGLRIDQDTLRFAMCKFVSPHQPRGFVNYEDMIRYFGKCLSSIHPNQYGRSQLTHSTNFHGHHHGDSPYRLQSNPYMNYSSSHP